MNFLPIYHLLLLFVPVALIYIKHSHPHHFISCIPILLFDLIAFGVSSFKVCAKSCPNFSAFFTKSWLDSLDICICYCITIVQLQLQTLPLGVPSNLLHWMG